MTVTHSIRNKNMVSPIPSRRTFLADSALIAGSAFFLENTGVSAMASPLENQEARKKLLQQCLGGPWPEGAPLDAKVEKTEQKDGYQLIRVNYLVEPNVWEAPGLKARLSMLKLKKLSRRMGINSFA